ncbi:hypothetical protein [Paenibacillus sp. O199]|uniref:hypothetical protein n=1 Tax=Paenibacillus sp. O199 TaxID=1643925 RepID=UPI0007BF73F7|nr:hypothetical protein [Paenibacillus sp. O199]
MFPNIHSLSKEENRLIEIAQEKYHIYFDLANHLATFQSNFLKSNIQKEANFFIGFMNQSNTSSLLSLLSILRHHTIQAKLTMRHSLEASMSACYALDNPDQEKFYTVNGEELIFKKKFMEKVYDWIKDDYPEQSKIIESDKKVLNGYTHSNFKTVALNVREMNNGQILSTRFFDNSYDDFLNINMTQLELFAYSTSVMNMLDLYEVVISNSDYVDLADNFVKEKTVLASMLRSIPIPNMN